MTQSSPRLGWPYPSQYDDPWFDGFEDLVSALDGSGFASREDRSIIWTGGGVLTWTLASGTLDWTDTISILSPISGKLIQIAAGSIASWADGEIVYVDITRSILANGTAAFSKVSTLPSTDDAMAFGVRVGNVIYLRTGISLSDGQTANGVAPNPGGSATDANAVHVNVSGEINGVALKATPVSADIVLLEDSADSYSKKKATVMSLPTTDSDAIHQSVGSEIQGITLKGTPISADILVIEDSADSFSKKRATIGSIVGSSGDKSAPAIIVGNQVAGDSASDVDYLDIGDGVQLAAAIAAASGSPARDVYIRPGTYDYSLGSLTGPITIPASVRVRGAGYGQVTISTLYSGNPVDPRAFSLSAGASLENVTIFCPDATMGDVQNVVDGIVTLGGYEATCRHVAVSFENGWTGWDLANNVTVEAAFCMNPGVSSTSRVVDCFAVNVPQILAAFGASPFASVITKSGSINTVSALVSYGADIGVYDSGGPVIVFNSEIDGTYDTIVNLSSENCEVHGNVLTRLASMGGDGVSIGSAAHRCSLQDNRIEGLTGASGANAINASSDFCIISGNRGVGDLIGGSGWQSALNISGDYNTVISNNFFDGVTPSANNYNDSGTGNDIAHNL